MKIFVYEVFFLNRLTAFKVSFISIGFEASLTILNTAEEGDIKVKFELGPGKAVDE